LLVKTWLKGTILDAHPMHDDIPPTLTETALGFLGYCIATAALVSIPLLMVYFLS